MSTDNDELPDPVLPENKGRTKAFTFGGDDDLDEGEMPVEPLAAADDLEPARYGLDGQPLEDLPAVAAEPSDPTFEPDIAVPLDTLQIAAAAEKALEDPAIRRINEISHERFLTKRPRVDEASRISRSWLESLDQRSFFLALGYPGPHLIKLLDHAVSLGQVRAWVEGLEGCSAIMRKLLTLEHLLDRRTQANRQRMATRQQIEDALRIMPKTASVAEILGGFDNIGPKDLARHPTSSQIKEGTAEEVRQLMRIVRPGEEASKARRVGSSLPVNKRLLGQGRPLGQRLIKPDSYCYQLAKKSVDEMGTPRMTPQQVMGLINQVADLENEFGVFYSIRRQDQKKPWCLTNIEFLPTEELERQRGSATRFRKEDA